MPRAATTPEQYAERILARLTLKPQGSWDRDVVEFATKVAEVSEVKAWIAEAIRHAIATEREACASVAETWGTHDDEPTNPDVAFGCIAAALRARGRA